MNKWATMTLLLALTMRNDSSSRRLGRKLTMQQQQQQQAQIMESQHTALHGQLQTGAQEMKYKYPAMKCDQHRGEVHKCDWTEKYQKQQITTADECCGCCCYPGNGPNVIIMDGESAGGVCGGEACNCNECEYCMCCEICNDCLGGCLSGCDGGCVGGC